MHCMTRISQQECRGILEQEETGENMSYTALYRKFRPDTFEDVKGQDHIVKTLRNQIKADRIGHAYLFCGTRGTGKTTVAKILARAVNCEHPVDGNPCIIVGKIPFDPCVIMIYRKLRPEKQKRFARTQ